MKLSSVLLGAAVVGVGYVAYTQLRPKPASSVPTNPTAPASSAVGDAANNLGATLLAKLSTVFGGPSSWRSPPSKPAGEATPTTVANELDINQSSYSHRTPSRDSLSYVI